MSAIEMNGFTAKQPPQRKIIVLMKVIMVLRAPLLIEMLFSRLFSEMIAHTQLFYKNNYLLYVKRGRGRIISRQGVKLQYPLKLGWYCKFQLKKEQNSISSTIKYKPSSI